MLTLGTDQDALLKTLNEYGMEKMVQQALERTCALKPEQS